MPPIKSRTHPAIKKLRDIRDRRDHQFIFCEGIKLVEELFDSRIKPTEVYCVAETLASVEEVKKKYPQKPVQVFMLSLDVMNYVSDLESAPGVIAIAKRPIVDLPVSSSAQPALNLVIHQVQLPQNVGALLRTAEAAGVTTVSLTQNTVDPFSPKTIRGSVGSVFRVNVRPNMDLATELEYLKSNGVQVLAASQNGTKCYDEIDWTQPSALVVGSEGSGFTPEEEKLFGQTIQIPMRGSVESLNVGTAAAICLFEAVRQRRKKGNK